MKDQLGSAPLQDLYELLFYKYLYVKHEAIHAYSERLVGQSGRENFHHEDVRALIANLK